MCACFQVSYISSDFRGLCPLPPGPIWDPPLNPLGDFCPQRPPPDFAPVPDFHTGSAAAASGQQQERLLAAELGGT